MNNMKKIAIASAVTAALGGTASVNAFTLGESGDAMLVPYALCDTANGINTMVGIVQAGQIGTKGLSDWAADPNFPTNDPSGPQLTTFVGNVHWFFFNATSTEQADGSFPVTHDDFHGFDWCQNAQDHDGGPGGALDGLEGYLVFADNAVLANPQAVATLNLFGDACVLQGNWGACAWDPVIPMIDTPDGAITTVNDEVTWVGGGPNVNPINAGIALGDDDGVDNQVVHMDLRYFLGDLGLGANAQTDLVFWFDDNYDSTADPANYSSIIVNVFDEDEVPGSTPMQLPNELNVIDASTIGWTITKQSGFVTVGLEEADLAVGDLNVGSSVAFSLIWFGPNPNDGVQTTLAHNRGLW